MLLVALASSSAPLARSPLSLACLLLQTGQLLLRLAVGQRALLVLQDLVLVGLVHLAPRLRRILDLEQGIVAHGEVVVMVSRRCSRGDTLIEAAVKEVFMLPMGRSGVHCSALLLLLMV